VLQCFHTYCQACLEKVQDHPDRVSCPQCHNDTTLGSGGVAGLLSDYGITGLMEMVAAAGSAGNTSGLDFAGTFCTGCKSRESAAAVARCMTCANFLCPNCVMAHKVCVILHYIRGHSITMWTRKGGNQLKVHAGSRDK
jgi:tripartite motif-containing protein 2/3